MQKQVKDVRLPQSLQRAMAAEAEAAREARAKVMMLVVMMVMVVTMVVMIMIFFSSLWCFFRFRFMIKEQVIAAEGEQKSSKALKEASDIISTSPAALQLR